MAILRSARGQCGSGKGATRGHEGLAQSVEHDRGHNEHEQDEVDDCERGRPRRFSEDAAVEVAKHHLERAEKRRRDIRKQSRSPGARIVRRKQVVSQQQEERRREGNEDDRQHEQERSHVESDLDEHVHDEGGLVQPAEEVEHLQPAANHRLRLDDVLHARPSVRTAAANGMEPAALLTRESCEFDFWSGLLM